MPTRQQAYEVFESTAPNAPLRRKTYISIWPPARRTTGRGTGNTTNTTRVVTAQRGPNLLASAASREDDDTRHHSSADDSSSEVASILPRDTSADMIRPSLVGPTCHSLPRGAMSSAGKSADSHSTQTPQRPNKAERFICAVLPATHPRFVIPSAPRISC